MSTSTRSAIVRHGGDRDPVLYHPVMVTAAPSDRCANLHKPTSRRARAPRETAEPEESGVGGGRVTAPSVT